jgi:hypothetical protein
MALQSPGSTYPIRKAAQIVNRWVNRIDQLLPCNLAAQSHIRRLGLNVE